MVFSLEHDIKVTKNHQNLLPTQSVLVAHTVLQVIGTFCWDITGIGLWWNDRFIGAQNRLRRNFSFR
jgi:hypothetical protein